MTKPPHNFSPPSPTRDAYLDIRISKLRHRNVIFPRRVNILNLATKTYNSITPFRPGSYILRDAFDMTLAIANFYTMTL